jgi:Rrf2 family nitric oxide-sensitive transcriptional repressor
MRLTKFTDNALRVLIYTAANSDRLTNISEITEKCNIPRNHLTKVVHAMSTEGLLETVRGKGGGVRLGRPAAEITVANVVRTMEPDLKIIECFVPRCPLAQKCKLRSVLDEGRSAFLDALGKYTIADLIGEEKELRDAGWL